MGSGFRRGIFLLTKGGDLMGEVLVSFVIGGCLVLSGVLMNRHLKKEADALTKEALKKEGRQK